MKKILILIVVFAFIGCIAEKKNETAKGGENSAKTVENKAEAKTISSPNTATQPVKSGEKVEQALEVNFKEGLPHEWEKIDPEKENPSDFNTLGGVLKLKIPSGKDLYGDNRTAPRLLKSVTGDFEIETRVKLAPKKDYQGAGILIFRNDNNYLRLERGYGGTGGGEDGIRFDKREDEIYEPIATQEKFPTSAGEVELKFRRKGKNFTAFWREANATEWEVVGEVSNNYPETVQIGLIGVNTADEITAEFTFIKILPLVK
jgi:hypothetical protein